MTNVEYINPRSGARWSTDEPIWRALDDGGHVNLTAGIGLRRNEIDPGEIGLWRYRKSIRIPSADTSTLGEGWTPLVPSEWAGASILMKCEHLMPSGSFKDRGTVVLFNYLKQCGTTEILEDSSGNAGASYATYAAALGLDCRIMVPASSPAGKKIQIAAMGAQIEVIEGSREVVAAAALKAAEVTFYASHNWQPFFLEGTKTLAFEIWEQLGFSVPDNIVVPLGYGSNVIGLHLGFLELLATGEIDRLPRIFGAQAANCAALHAAWEAGGTAVDFPISASLADGITSEKPVRVAEVMTAVRETGGNIVVADEDEIEMAFWRLAVAGFFIEPTSATAGAVLSRLIEARIIGREETTVLVLTGHGLKAVDKIAQMSKD
jgi:threonine synthase